jgi:hypothetical protein
VVLYFVILGCAYKLFEFSSISKCLDFAFVIEIFSLDIEFWVTALFFQELKVLTTFIVSDEKSAIIQIIFLL